MKDFMPMTGVGQIYGKNKKTIGEVRQERELRKTQEFKIENLSSDLKGISESNWLKRKDDAKDISKGLVIFKFMDGKVLKRIVLEKSDFEIFARGMHEFPYTGKGLERFLNSLLKDKQLKYKYNIKTKLIKRGSKSVMVKFVYVGGSNLERYFLSQVSIELKKRYADKHGFILRLRDSLLGLPDKYKLKTAI